MKLGVMAHTFNPRPWEPKPFGSLSVRLAYSTKQVPGHPGLHRVTLSLENQKLTKSTSECLSYYGSY